MSKLLWVVIGGVAGYALARSTHTCDARQLEIACAAQQRDSQTIAQALLVGGQAIDRMEPMLVPIAAGDFPPVSTILSTLNSRVR